MSEFYADVSALGNEYQAYAAAMTWGALATDKPLPQDGTGLAGPGHSAAVAIAEIKINALPADGNTLSVAGAVVTAKTAAAAKNQWTLGASVSACATNLVALLNTFGTSTAQCDAAVSTSASKLALALPYFLYARVKPGATDTVQIATRFAGSDLNHAANSFVAISHGGWGTAPTFTQFAGGADGPFAYLYNTGTVFGKTATTAPAYGLFFASACGPSEPGVGDVVHLRTKRSGADLNAPVWSTSSTISANWKARNYLADNGTTWSGDSGKLTATLKYTNASSVSNSLGVGSGISVCFASRAKYGFELQVSSTVAASATFTAFSASGTDARTTFNKCCFAEATDNVGGIRLGADGGSTTNACFDLCDSLSQFRGQMRAVYLNSGSGTNPRLLMNGHEIEVVSASGALGVPIQFQAGPAGAYFEWVGGAIRDTLGVYRCASPVTSTSATIDLDALIDGVVGVTDPSVGFSANATRRSRFRWISQEGPNKGFRFECPQYTLDWKGDGTFPYAGVAADLRGVNWSHRLTWNASPTYALTVTPLRLSRFYRGTAAVKTLTVELYVPDATTVYLDELELTVSYLDSTDVWRTESIGGTRAQQFASSRTALSASSTAWMGNGVANHSAKKIELTTGYAIKQNSEIVARLGLCKSRSPTVTFFASPELGAA